MSFLEFDAPQYFDFEEYSNSKSEDDDLTFQKRKLVTPKSKVSADFFRLERLVEKGIGGQGEKKRKRVMREKNVNVDDSWEKRRNGDLGNGKRKKKKGRGKEKEWKMFDDYVKDLEVRVKELERKYHALSSSGRKKQKISQKKKKKRRKKEMNQLLDNSFSYQMNSSQSSDNMMLSGITEDLDFSLDSLGSFGSLGHNKSLGEDFPFGL